MKLLVPLRRVSWPLFVLGGFAVGWCTAHGTAIGTAQSGLDEPVNLSDDTAEKIKVAYGALTTAQATLQQEQLYEPAIRGLNGYAVFVGGLDALGDLEAGRGVDPVTFAGLHTGQGIDAVLPHLALDETGRLTYKGKLVRMYSVERMKRLEAQQKQVLEASEGGRRNLGPPM